MTFMLKSAEALKPGDRIVTDREGTIRTVTDATELDRWGGCTIHHSDGTIITGLPCPVKVVQAPGTGVAS
jgi:hypothetical protein